MRPTRHSAGVAAAALAILPLLASVGCEHDPQASVVLDNEYAKAAPLSLPIYAALWQEAAILGPIAPGASSDPQDCLAASDNTAYVILAPGWDADAGAPSSFLLMQSRHRYTVHLDETLHIPVDDSTFIGNCFTGNPLSQEQADFISERIFTPAIFDAAAPPAFHYDAATCTMTPIADGGA